MTFTKRALRQTILRLLMACMLAFLAAYGASRLGFIEWPRRYDPLAFPDLRDTDSFLTDWQMKLVDGDPEGCVATLRRAGLSMSLKPVSGAGTDCEVVGAVDLARLSTATLRPEPTRCAIAARLYRWEYHVVQPAARRYFKDEVAEILHFGSFNCRTMRGRGSMSQHATANAYDISGFRLKSGKTISVKRDWDGTAPQAKFLRAVRDGACEHFNLVLSPDFNADHADHFHVDMGWYRSCR